MNAAAVIAAPVEALQIALEMRALTPRAARIAQIRCDLARADRRGDASEAEGLTHRMCFELWAPR